MNWPRIVASALAGLLISTADCNFSRQFVRAGTRVIDFEELPLAMESHYNGADSAGGFTSGGAFFNNVFTDFGSGCCWNGWAYTSETNTESGTVAGQYSAIPGGGAAGSSQYAVAFSGADAGSGIVPQITLPPHAEPISIEVTNNTFAALVMRNGDSASRFTDRFGGPAGTDPDWFRLTIWGLDADGAALGSVDFYLADFRPIDGGDDHIVDHWSRVDLAQLQSPDVARLAFRLDSTHANEIGILTPAYVAIDNLALVLRASADFDNDGDVDSDDLTVWESGFGLPVGASLGDGDADRDGNVDGHDFLAWQSQHDFAAVGMQSVPEPVGILYVAMFLFTILIRRHAPGAQLR